MVTIATEIVDNFAFTVGATSGGLSPLTASAIMVTPSTFTGGYQLFFSATGNTTSTGFMVTGSDFANYEIDFTWDPVVVGAEDQMNANSPTAPGTATVTTDLCAGSIFGGSCPPPTNTLTVFDGGPTAHKYTHRLYYFLTGYGGGNAELYCPGRERRQFRDDRLFDQRVRSGTGDFGVCRHRARCISAAAF